MRNCWICNKAAFSSEHKIKKSDIVRMWGKGPYINDNELAHLKNGAEGLGIIRGPRSRKLKYDKILCQNCNSVFTKPFDNAYEEFIDWFETNKKDVLKRRMIDFKSVYEDEFENKQRNLFKYFAKAFGCRLADAGISVPSDISNLLFQDYFLTGLKVSFHVNEDMALLPENDQFVGIHDLLILLSDNLKENGYCCGHIYKWLNINYWYLYLPHGGLGATWVADSQYIYLGSAGPLTKEQRKELKQKIKLRKILDKGKRRRNGTLDNSEHTTPINHHSGCG